ncbi:MAG: HNH endonuclease [Candidatus Hodarchaeales archaeon]
MSINLSFSSCQSTHMWDDLKFDFDRNIGANAYHEDFGVNKSDCLSIGFNTVEGGLVDVTATLGDGKGIQWYNVSQGWQRTIFFINTSGGCEVIIARAPAFKDTVHVKGSVIIHVQGADRMAGGITYEEAAEPLPSPSSTTNIQYLLLLGLFIGLLILLYLGFFVVRQKKYQKDIIYDRYQSTGQVDVDWTGLSPPVEKKVAYKKATAKTYIDKNGYLRFNDSNKLVHRWVMEKRIRRKLKINEDVHHIDGNKLNNAISNLQLMKAEDHHQLHLNKWKKKQKN